MIRTIQESEITTEGADWKRRAEIQAYMHQRGYESDNNLAWMLEMATEFLIGIEPIRIAEKLNLVPWMDNLAVQGNTKNMWYNVIDAYQFVCSFDRWCQRAAADHNVLIQNMLDAIKKQDDKCFEKNGHHRIYIPPEILVLKPFQDKKDNERVCWYKSWPGKHKNLLVSAFVKEVPIAKIKEYLLNEDSVRIIENQHINRRIK